MNTRTGRQRRRQLRTLTQNKNLLAALVFLLRFNLFAIPLYLIIFSGYSSGLLIRMTADITYGMLHATGIEAERSGNLISMPVENGNWAAVINWDCVGWKSMLVMLALVMATPSCKRKKLYGIALLPLVYAINIIRIWFMFFFVSKFGLAYFGIVHAVVWSWGLLIAVLLLWLVWIRRF